MGQGLELTGVAGVIALLIPLILLAIVVMRGTRSRRAGDARAAGRRKASLPKTHASPDPAPLPPPAPVDATAASALAPPPEAEPEPDPTAVAALSAQRLAVRIAQAEAAGAEEELPRLYLDEARLLVLSGDAAQAADRLRKSLRSSARLGLKLEHARARLELGDIASSQGDLTTACEHWSIARGLLYELKRSDDIKKAEDRIRNNGCPTDWVLNDF